MSKVPFAQVSLRFRAGRSETELAALFAALPRWEPALTPTTVVRRGPGWPPALTPLGTQDLAELARACVAGRVLDWTFGTRSGQAAWSTRTELDQICIDAWLPFGGALEPRVVALIDGLPPGDEPGMAYVIDRLRDEPLTRDGLHGVTAMPPALFLDGAVVALLGGARVRSAPCRVRDVGTGLLLVVSDDLDASVTPAAYARRADVLTHLGLYPGAALR
jgi:hypothetical protein